MGKPVKFVKEISQSITTTHRLMGREVGTVTGVIFTQITLSGITRGHPTSSLHRSSTQRVERVQVKIFISGQDTHLPDLFCINTKPSVLYLQKCLQP